MKENNQIQELEKSILQLRQYIKNERNNEVKSAMIGKLEALEKLLESFKN